MRLVVCSSETLKKTFISFSLFLFMSLTLCVPLCLSHSLAPYVRACVHVRVLPCVCTTAAPTTRDGQSRSDKGSGAQALSFLELEERWGLHLTDRGEESKDRDTPSMRRAQSRVRKRVVALAVSVHDDLRKIPSFAA